ncbi:ATP-binding protein [Micromonospora sp. NPDC092111]|uniref:ATP-binding protein n=1 Tax=Micromonospora sp. NPDC092111 TaxID=3364289 RepID=UPI003815B128
MDGDGSFAVVLRAARHGAGLTLEELAEASGVSVRALSDMERGRALGPQRRTVVSIADALTLAGAARDQFVALARAGRARPAYLAAAPGLCELPGSIGDFTGRHAELAWIFELVDQRAEAAGRTGVAVISGGAGLGKTTLAVRAAHRLRDRFPGGVHFVEALGMSGHPIDSGEILARVLRALGARGPQIPEVLAERAGRYRQLLRERRVLVVIDDAASEAQVRPLVPGDGDSQLLVTSRRMLAGLSGVQRLHLGPMPALDAHDLLDRIVAERVGATAAEDLGDLVDLLGGLPLALRIAGNRLVSRPQWGVADLLRRLSIAERRLDQLSAGDLKVAAAFEMSYGQLPDSARALFRRMAVVPGSDFSAELARVIAAVPLPVAEDELDELVDLSLLETADGGRYRLHDLVRLYANRCLQHEEHPDDVTAVQRRMVDWLLTTLADAGTWFGPNPPDAADSAFETAEDAEAWIRTEADHWYPALTAAAGGGDHQAVVDTVSTLGWVLDRWAHWPHWPALYMRAHDSAAALGAPDRQAEFLTALAWTYTQPGRDFQPALAYGERALALARGVGDLGREGRAWLVVARAQSMLGDLHAARDAVQAAADRFEQIGNADDYCQALIGHGAITMALGELDESVSSFRQALAMADNPAASGMTASNAEATLPFVLGHLARALGRAGRPGEGVPLAERGVATSAQMRNADAEAAILLILAEELYDDTQTTKARTSLLRAANIYESIGQHDEAARRREQAAARTPAGS